MSRIHIQRSHHLPQRRVMQDVDELAGVLQEQLDAECHWQDDILTFERRGASGRIQVADDLIDIEIRLSALLRPLKGRIETTINQYLDEHLGEPTEAD